MTKKSEHIKEKNRELIREIKLFNNQRAVLELIRLNTPYITKMATTFKAPLEINDLVSEGIAAMFSAITNFDIKRETDFMSYASWKIRFAMQTYMDSLRAVKVSRYKSVQLIKEGKEEELNELTYACNFDQIGEIDRYRMLDDSPDAEVLTEELLKEIHRAVARINNIKIRTSIILYFGLGAKKLKMQAIAKILGVSQSMVSKYIASGLELLRKDEGLSAWG